MNTENLNIKSRKDFEEWAVKMRSGYAAMGEFIVEFSQLEFTVRVSLGRSLKLPSDLVNPVLSYYDFVSLCKVWQLVVDNEYPKNSESTKKICSQLLELNTHRLRVAHGLWSPGLETFEAIHISRGSSKVGAYFTEPGELKSLAGECQRLMQVILEFKGDVCS